MNNLSISFDDFKKYIMAVKNVFEFQEDIFSVSNKFNKTSSDETEICFPTLSSEVVSLLSKITKDNAGWIEYWIFELNFGEKYKDGTVKDENGNNIPLKTIEDLWAFICKESNIE